MRILIVDDDEITLEFLSSILIDLGYEVATARNGEEGMELLQTGLYRLVILDWMMPGMSGVELCRKIRSGPLADDCYIILLTSRRQPSDVVEGLKAGANDFIIKPIEPDELSMRVRAGETHSSRKVRDVAAR